MTTLEKAVFNRTERLVGPSGMERLQGASVIIFGLGGVGGWCAEALMRSGVRRLTLVDSDCVCITNVNRQVMATTKTIGKVKVEVLRDRLLEINPKADIKAVQAIYCAETADRFPLEEYDYVLDCIDSLKDKMDLLLRASALPGTLFSAMGAALKMDPTAIKVAPFSDVRGCPLAAAIRKKMRREKKWPAKEFLCVYDEEVLENRGNQTACGTQHCMCPQKTEGDPALAGHEWCTSKAVINGTLAHVTGIFGFTLAGLVIQHILGTNP